MNKEVNFSAYPPMSELILAKDSAMVIDTAAFVQLKREFTEIIDLRNITTAFRIQPLDHFNNRLLKRIGDIIFSLLMITCVLSWLTPIIALLVKMDSRGPVFFLQKRNKRNGELFTCIKFRSMIVNPEADILPAGKNDKRITRIGRFLREYYLDELPQFFNVFWGDMSVIGPRPHMISDNLQYDQMTRNYSYRHKVKPGITGLAQVLGYVGLVDEPQKLEARVNIDIFYVRHWSFKLDGVILSRTLKKLCRI